MSVQVAKSSAPTAGRRTPLQMSGSGKSNKAQQQPNVSETEKEKDMPTKEQNPPSSSTTTPKGTGKGDKNESTDLKKGMDKKTTNADNQSTENSNSAKDKSSDEKKKEDKKNTREAVKKDDKKQENGVNEGKETTKANGHKEAEKKIRETPRQKDLREQREKEEKEQEAKRLKEAAEELKKKTEETEAKNEAKEKEVEPAPPKVEEKEAETKKKIRKEPETPKKGEKKSRDADSVTPIKETQITPKATPTSKSIASLAFEKELKVFYNEGEEMEALLFDADMEVNEGEPIETSTPGKILKLRQSPPKAAAPKSYERQEIYERYGQVSTTKSDKTDSPPSAPLERPQFTSSYRAISGRRSLRPTKEYSFHGSSMGTYRKINSDLDYTASSMNATVGSEIANESSFSFFGRGKKRERTPPIISSNDSDVDLPVDIELSPKSPKRPRLDFSGILGIVASPVTMLRSKLSRTKIQCSSTPNGKVTSTTSKDEEDGVENVSVIATEEVATTEMPAAVEDVSIKDVEQEDLDEDELIEDADEDIEEPADLKKPLNAQQQLQQPVSTSMDSVNKRRMCNVM